MSRTQCEAKIMAARWPVLFDFDTIHLEKYQKSSYTTQCVVLHTGCYLQIITRLFSYWPIYQAQVSTEYMPFNFLHHCLSNIFSS